MKAEDWRLRIVQDRQVFLKAAKEEVPEFLDGLRKSISPELYFYLADVTDRQMRAWRKDPVFDPIRQPFETWIQRFNVKGSWLQVAALKTLRYWALGVRYGRALAEFAPGCAAEWCDGLVTFETDLAFESKRVALARLKQQIAEAERGLPESRHRVLSSEHARWLVLHLFLGLLPAEIQRRSGRKGDDASTILKGIKGAAKRLGIPLGALARGRPVGSRDRRPRLMLGEKGSVSGRL